MILSIVVVNWNTAPLLRDCLASLARDPGLSAGASCETLVVDNASTDGSAEMVLSEFPRVGLLRNEENLGFARANNRGIQASTGEWVLLLNSDTLAPPGALPTLLRWAASRPRLGAASPRLVRPDGSPQPFAFGDDPTLPYLVRRGVARVLFGRSLHDWGTGCPRPVDWVSGACLLLRRRALDEVGLLDEGLFMYFEDNDLCLRLRRAGWEVWYQPETAVVHLGGQSLKGNPQARQAYQASMRYFYAKHYGRFSRLGLDLGLAVYGRINRGGGA